MTIDHVVEFIIEAMHEDLAGRDTLGVRLVQNFPALPASQLSAAFSAAADAIEEMFEHEGHPTDQANRARALAAEVARDAARLGTDAPDVAALGQLWAAGEGAFPTARD